MKLPLIPYEFIVRRVGENTSAERDPRTEFVEISRNYEKIFCIGFHKTGTTTMAKLLTQFGFTVGKQPVAEILAEDWSLHKRSDRIINYCYTADAFQDAPFNYPGMFKELDHAFPRSKFILTTRENPEEWFSSLVRFHTKLFSSDKSRPPDEEDLRNAVYRYKGYMLQLARNCWDYPATPLYEENAHKKKYLDHIDDARAYFKNRQENFIEINVAHEGDFNRLCDFLQISTSITGFPWENKT